MDKLSFQPVLHPYLAIAAIVALLAMLFIGPSFSRLTGGRRLTLTILRLIAIGLVSLAVFRPGCVSSVEKRQSALLLFLLDTSRSMELPHRSDQSERWEALVKMLQDNESKLKALQEQQTLFAIRQRSRSVGARWSVAAIARGAHRCGNRCWLGDLRIDAAGSGPTLDWSDPGHRRNAERR
jgi:hypothetical protein